MSLQITNYTEPKIITNDNPKHRSYVTFYFNAIYKMKQTLSLLFITALITSSCSKNNDQSNNTPQTPLEKRLTNNTFIQAIQITLYRLSILLLSPMKIVAKQCLTLRYKPFKVQEV